MYNKRQDDSIDITAKQHSIYTHTQMTAGQIVTALAQECQFHQSFNFSSLGPDLNQLDV